MTPLFLLYCDLMQIDTEYFFCLVEYISTVVTPIFTCVLYSRAALGLGSPTQISRERAVLPLLRAGVGGQKI